MSEANTSGDSSELEALFDSIASGVARTARCRHRRPRPSPAAPRPSLMQQAREGDGSSEDSQDLQALFDSIAGQQDAACCRRWQCRECGVGEIGEWPAQKKVFSQVGLMASQLHDTLGDLGYDKLIEQTVNARSADAKDRLAYIANLTEQAACKVLNATDIANPLQDELETGASLLDAKWEQAFRQSDGRRRFPAARRGNAHAFLKNAVPQRTKLRPRSS